MQSYPSYKNVYAQIISVCPSAHAVFSAENQIMPPARLATDFANHLLESYRLGHVEEFPSLAILIEKSYRLSDVAVREWATLGLLEAIQTVWSRTEVEPSHFRRYLLSQSLKDWDRLASFWSDQSFKHTF